MSEITPLAILQKTHGAALAQISNSPAFLAALEFLNAEKLGQINILEDGTLQTHGVLILADLRGHLRLAHDIQTLHERPILEFSSDELSPTYPSPEEEAAEENIRTKVRKKK